MSTPHHPVFPLELFELVFQSLYHAPISNNSAALEPCSLVCKSFAAICQPLIFEEISGIGISDSERERLLRLVDVLENKPSLLQSVRKLWFSFEFDEHEPSTIVISEVEWQRSQIVLLSFSNLATLEIESRLVSPFPFPHLGDAAISLVNTYAHQSSLHKLFVEAFDAPFQEILASRYLQTLRIGFIGPPSSIFNPGSESSITRLTLEEVEDFSLSFLTYLPHLERLDLDGVISLKVGPMARSGCPSFKLEILNIRFYLDPESDITLLSIFVDFYKARAVIANVGPFDALQHLVIYVLAKEDIPSLQVLLECTPKLQTLSLEEQRYTFGFDDAVFLLLTYVLGQCIRNSLPLLGCLAISLSTKKEAQASDTLLAYLVSLFNTFSEHNALKIIQLKIDTGTDGFDLPSRDAWSQLGALFACPEGYPELEKVSVEICLAPQREYGEIVQASAVGRDVSELEDMLLNAMDELISCGDVVFNGSVRLQLPAH